jgi:hypothetical protein
VVCEGADDTRTQTVPPVPFPYPQRLLHLSFCEKKRVALFPSASTSKETLSNVAAWLKLLGYAAVVFPVAARLLPRAA